MRGSVFKCVYSSILSAQIDNFCEALLLFWQNINICYEQDTHFLKGWTFNLTFFQLCLSQKF